MSLLEQLGSCNLICLPYSDFSAKMENLFFSSLLLSLTEVSDLEEIKIIINVSQSLVLT